ncbi:MAG: alpha/beta fold hydrolase [Crocinitomicaceae bacterium]|nr:alpha/beta fold hydrolase [Crocinitomicaceae bacterium]
MENKALLNFITHRHSTSQEWLLLIHGAGGSTRTWKRQIDDFGKDYNLLVIDLPGHGENQTISTLFPTYSFKFIANKVWEVVDHLQIEKLHAVGVSLGTIICLQMRQLQPNRLLSIIMPGAIVKLSRKLKVLAGVSLTAAKVIGYRNFYNLSARIMLPRKNHKRSRNIFIRESKALTIAEFKKWTALYRDLNKILRDFFKAKSTIPHLLIMGSQDHLFLKPAIEYAGVHANADIKVIQGCGHVVSIEKAQKFNKICLDFLRKVEGI